MGTVRDLFLRDRGLLFVEPGGGSTSESHLRVFELELAELGYLVSTRLRERLATLPVEDMLALHRWALPSLATVIGHRKHVPLFRKFPQEVPRDTDALWVTRVLTHLVASPDQPCPWCRHEGTTHVLSPCQHVVCERCFDGDNYSACPVCQRHVDTESPFFGEDGKHTQPLRPPFRLLDLGGDLREAAKQWFTTLCARTQPLSPDHQHTLDTLCEAYPDEVPTWIPDAFVVREVAARVLGAVMRSSPPAVFLDLAAMHLRTATDVLRVIAAYSGHDPALQGKVVLATEAPAPQRTAKVIKRFQVGKLRRPLRRALLGLLERLPPATLTEDMLRHRSYWVWVGQFLHPHEYAKRFPNVAQAFAVVRCKTPDGTAAPRFRGFYAQLEAASARGDAATMLALLERRPGEFARRLDHLLRIADTDAALVDTILQRFQARVRVMATPVLVTLAALLPTRTRTALPYRLFWPKGTHSTGIARHHSLPLLPADTVAAATRQIEGELLRRFGAQPQHPTVVLDRALADIVVPFNTRTASQAAVALPRGSRVPLPPGHTLRLFLHWCQPEHDADETDLDLSVAFYDEAWACRGVCSYYQLECAVGDDIIARSAGDLQDAPFPDGASEFVDIHRETAQAHGLRYAAVIVNAYAGMSFGKLERAFAGVMVREDTSGAHFDPQTVRLRFNLDGSRGIYLPLVVDLHTNTLHWLDTYSDGQLQHNTAASSNTAVRRICPEMIDYFASGQRMSMFELGLLHAAARAQRVILRGEHGTTTLQRQPGEEPSAFLRRLREAGPGTEPLPPLGEDLLALLHTGDVQLPDDARCYALFRHRVTSNLTANDLLPGA
jgi:hypothetical protein